MGAEQIVTLTGDDAALFKAYQRIIDQQIKMEKGLDRVADKAKKAKEAVKPLEASDFSEANATLDEFGNLASLGGDKMAKMVGSVSNTSIALGAAATVMRVIIGHQERMNELAREQLETSNALAKSQAEAIKNMAVFSMPDTQDILSNELPSIARKTGFSNIGLLTQAVGESISIVPKEQAIDAVTVAAELNTLTPDGLKATAAGLSDLMVTTQVPNANEVYGLVSTLQPNARPADTVQFIKNLSKSTAAANATKGQEFDAKEASREAGAAFAFLTTQTTDLTGDSSSSNLANLMSYTQSMFGDLGREDRAKRLIELEPQLRSEKDAGKRKLIQQEIDDLKALNAATVNDPGSFATRRQSIMNNPVLQRQFLRNLPGEAIFKPVFTQMFTPGSSADKGFQKVLSETWFDKQAVANFKQKRDSTGPMIVAQHREDVDAELNAWSLDNPSLEAVGEVRQTVDKALKQAESLPDSISGTIYKNLGNIPFVAEYVTTPLQQAYIGNELPRVLDYAEKRIQSRIEDALIGATTEQKASREFQRGIEALEKVLVALDELGRKLQSTPPPPPPANPGTINNQFKAGKGM